MSSDVTIRAMDRSEVLTLVGWATLEGWNPGLHDTQLFWEADPDAFMAADQDGQMVGGGSIASYDGEFGFMGFFIVRPEYRGHGLGAALWQARKQDLTRRLRVGATISMDGVAAMQQWYAKGGFAFSHRDVRYQGVGAASSPAAGVVPAGDVPCDALMAYDTRCFAAPRARFLKAWLSQPAGRAYASMRGGTLAGYGVIRRCHEGAKIGPLFADDAAVAAELFDALADLAIDEPVFLDVPETNPAAIAFAEQRHMQEVFACARMYAGPRPALAEERIFGVTSFEFG